MPFTGTIRIGPKKANFLNPQNCRKLNISDKLGDGVASFSKNIAPVHISLMSKDLSQIFSYIESKYKGITVDYKQLKADIVELSDKNGLGIELGIVMITGDSLNTINGTSSKMQIMYVLLPKGSGESLMQSLTILVGGEEIAVVNLMPEKNNLALLAAEGKLGLPISMGNEGNGPFNIKIKGDAISEMVVMGKARVVKDRHLALDEYPVRDLKAEAQELGVTFEEFLEKRIEEANKAFDKSIESLSSGAGEKFQYLVPILEEFKKAVLDIMNERGIAAADAMKALLKENYLALKNNEDEKQRSLYAEFVGMFEDVLAHKHNTAIDIEEAVIASKHDDVILVINDLSPNRMGVLNLNKLKGIIIQKGSTKGHVANRARQKNKAGIVKAKGVIDQINDGDIIIIDGQKGLLIIRPDGKTTQEYNGVISSISTIEFHLKDLRNKPLKMEGSSASYEILANVSFIEDVVNAILEGYDGFALVRTEDWLREEADGEERTSEPSIKEQTDHYNGMIAAAKGKIVVFRTLDPDADKLISYVNLDFSALGTHNKGLSLCLEKDSPMNFIFRNQIESLLRTTGKCRVMFPVVKDIDELESSDKNKMTAFSIIDAIRKDLTEVHNVKVNDEIEWGVMVEHTAILKHLKTIRNNPRIKFFSIGTSDLVADILNVNRQSPLASKLLKELDPKAIKALIQIYEELSPTGKDIEICGSMPNNWRKLLLLYAIGYSKMSFDPNMADLARKIILSVKKEDLDLMLKNILTLNSAEEIEKYIEEFTLEKIEEGRWDMRDILPKLFPKEGNPS